MLCHASHKTRKVVVLVVIEISQGKVVSLLDRVRTRAGKEAGLERQLS
jgi:hypothetical protein